MHKLWAVVMLTILAGCATPMDPIKRAPSAGSPTFDEAKIQNTIEFSKVILGLDSGAVYGQLSGGLLCIPGAPLKWDGGTSTLSEGPLVAAVRDSFRNAGIKLAADPNQLFNTGPKALANSW